MATSNLKKKKLGRLKETPFTFAIDRHDRYFSRAVAKTFQLMDFLSRARSSLALNELSRQMRLSKTSVFRLLHTLQVLHYVKQDAEGKYAIAAENWISPPAQIANILLRIAEEPVRALYAQFHESISLAVIFTNHIEVVQVFESRQAIRMANAVGDIIPPHASSLGKAIAAFQREDIRYKLIQSYGIRRFTEHTIIDEATLRQELDQVREVGYAHEEEEAFLDGCCFGCPIFGGEETAVAAISISMPISRKPQGKAQEAMITALIGAAEEITKNLKKNISGQ